MFRIVILGDLVGLQFALAVKASHPEVDVSVLKVNVEQQKNYDTALTFPTMCRIMQVDPLEIAPHAASIKLGMTYQDWTTSGSRNIFTGSVNLSTKSLVRSIYHDRYPEFDHSGQGLVDLWVNLYRHGHRTAEDFMPDLSETFGFAEDDVDARSAVSSGVISDKFGWTVSVQSTEYMLFLEQLAQQRGITVEAAQQVVVTTKNNCIVDIATQLGSHSADLFVDATGTNRMLISKIDNRWNHCDDLTNDIQQSQSPGYSRRHTGTVNWHPNGYLLGSWTPDLPELDFVSASSITGKIATYAPGWYQQCAVTNCLALGNAAGKIDPMDASENNYTNRMISFVAPRLSTQLDWESLQPAINQLHCDLFADLDLVSQYKIRLCPRSDSNYWRAMRQSAQELKLLEQLDDDIHSTRRRHGSQYQHRAYNITTLINLVLHYQLPVILQDITNIDHTFLELAQKHFDFVNKRNKIILYTF